MSIDTIGNFLTIIRNAILASKSQVYAPLSKMNMKIANILKEEGFVKSVVAEDKEDKHGGVVKCLKLDLKYINGESVIHSLVRVSKPSRRIYVGAKKIKPVTGGLGISIISTSQGIMTDKQARSKEVFSGGEIVCKVW